jgi:hypothetical protein
MDIDAVFNEQRQFGLKGIIVNGRSPGDIQMQDCRCAPGIFPWDIERIQMVLTNSRALGTLTPESRTASRLRWAICRSFSCPA